jgi:hypothetical protein
MNWWKLLTRPVNVTIWECNSVPIRQKWPVTSEKGAGTWFPELWWSENGNMEVILETKEGSHRMIGAKEIIKQSNSLVGNLRG